ncbi:MAG: putative zinc-binding metallopeptidase [Phycisphaerales bacterium]
MPPATARTPFRESLQTPIKDLGLTIEGTRLEPIIKAFEAELGRAGIKLRPKFYLSTEWGVPFGTVSMAIPFYLARPDLTEIHAEKMGVVEGFSQPDILRYLRHEMGHIVNYAYRLYEREEWVNLFGSITQPYLEEYRPSPFSRRYVRHLPGWYAQKHPDEDWAETFAVWITPKRDWKAEYAGWPSAMAKLEYCDQIMAELRTRDPEVTASDSDEDVGTLPYTLDQFYQRENPADGEMPPGLAGALRAIFEDLGESDAAGNGSSQAPRRPAAALIRRLERDLLANVFRWTGHFPEHTRTLVRHLADLAEKLNQVYPEDREKEASMAVTTLVTALAMNHVHGGSYLA